MSLLRTSASGLAAALLLGGCASPPHVPLDELFRQRLAWWQSSDHALDIAALYPLETVAGAAGPAIPVASLPTLDPAAAAAAIRLVAALHTQSLLIWQRGALQLEWYGPGYGPDSRSSPASMMKPVLALAVGQAIARHRLRSVDEPVGTYLTEWAHDPRGAITIRQLLQMSSGLRKDGATGSDPRGTQLMLGVEMEPLLLQTPLAAPPGSAFD